MAKRRPITSAEPNDGSQQAVPPVTNQARATQDGTAQASGPHTDVPRHPVHSGIVKFATVLVCLITVLGAAAEFLDYLGVSLTAVDEPRPPDISPPGSDNLQPEPEREPVGRDNVPDQNQQDERQLLFDAGGVRGNSVVLANRKATIEPETGGDLARASLPGEGPSITLLPEGEQGNLRYAFTSSDQYLALKLSFDPPVALNDWHDRRLLIQGMWGETVASERPALRIELDGNRSAGSAVQFDVPTPLARFLDEDRETRRGQGLHTLKLVLHNHAGPAEGILLIRSISIE